MVCSLAVRISALTDYGGYGGQGEAINLDAGICSTARGLVAEQLAQLRCRGTGSLGEGSVLAAFVRALRCFRAERSSGRVLAESCVSSTLEVAAITG